MKQNQKKTKKHFEICSLQSIMNYNREVLHVEVRNFFDRLICRNSQSRISANERFCKQKIRFPSVAKQRKNGDVRFCQAETAEIWLRNIFLYQNDLHGPWRIWWTEKNKTSLLLFSCCPMMRVISTMMNFFCFSLPLKREILAR